MRLPVLFGVIGIFATAVLAVFLGSATGYEVGSFSLFYVIPVGGLFIGFLGAAGLFCGFRIANIKFPRKKAIWTGFVLGICAFIAAYYLDYNTQYSDLDGNVSNHVSSPRLSGLEKTSDHVTFSEWLKIINEGADFKTVGDVGDKATHLGPLATALTSIISLLGAALGGMGAAAICNVRYCDRCKAYFKSKKIWSGDYADQTDMAERIAAACAAVKSRDLRQLGKLARPVKFAGKVIVTLSYCPDCMTAEGIVAAFRPIRQNKRGLAEVPGTRVSVPVDPASIALLLAK